MNRSILRLALPLLCTSLLACSGLPEQVEPPQAEPVPAAATSPQAPAGTIEPTDRPTSGGLNSDIVYNLVVGEIAIQRGDLEKAYFHLLEGAIQSRDPKSAERAARVAMHSQRYDQAQVAVVHWLDFAPQDPAARQLAVILAVKNNDEASAYAQLKEMVEQGGEGPERFLHATAALLPEQHPKLALKLMQQLIEEEGQRDDPDAVYAFAVTAVIAKEYALGEAKLRQLLAAEPGNSKALILLSRVRTAREDRADALRVLEQGVTTVPTDTSVRSAYARLLLESEREEDGYTQYLELRDQEPQNAEIHFSLGAVAMQLERFEEARGHFLKLIEMRERLNEAAYYLGWITEIEGDSKGAIEWYRKVDGDELQAEALIRVSRLLSQQGELNSARELLQRLRVEYSDRSPQLYLIEGEILRGEKEPELARQVYDEALIAHPGNTELLYARAMLLIMNDEVAGAESDLQAILVQSPDNVDALNALGYTLADMTDRHQEAYGYIQRALELKQDSPAIIDSMGWVEYRLGNIEQALAHLEHAFEMMKDAEIAAHLGEVLWVLGNRERARQVWDEGLKVDPDNKYLLRALERFLPQEVP